MHQVEQDRFPAMDLNDHHLLPRHLHSQDAALHCYTKPEPRSTCLPARVVQPKIPHLTSRVVENVNPAANRSAESSMSQV